MRILLQITYAANKNNNGDKEKTKRQIKLTTSLSVWGQTSRNQAKWSFIFVYDSVELMIPH